MNQATNLIQWKNLTDEQKIEEKWPDKEVVMLEWEEGMLIMNNGMNALFNTHINAQSMKGFAGYIYKSSLEHAFPNPIIEGDDGSKQIFFQPIAVLFEVEK